MYYTLISAGNMLFQLMSVLILANVLFSWIRPNRENPIVDIIYSMTEPILAPFRKISLFGPVDFSAFFALLAIRYVIRPLYHALIGMIFL